MNYIIFFLLVLNFLFLFLILIKKKKEHLKHQTINYTITGKKDGFGAQYQAIMSGIAYCMYKNYNYIHTPIEFLGHNEDVKKLNKFMGIPPNRNKNININIKKRYEQNVHYSQNPDQYYTPKVINKIRKYYYSTEKPELEDIDIAIHIRRGDVNKKMSERFTTNEKYKEIIEKMKNKYPNYSITIFSEGDEKDFKELLDSNVKLRLNTDIEETFHSLVEAKILVMAKSSFSYCAGILNKNTVYYINFWHKPLKKWNIIE